MIIRYKSSKQAPVRSLLPEIYASLRATFKKNTNVHATVGGETPKFDLKKCFLHIKNMILQSILFPQIVYQMHVRASWS